MKASILWVHRELNNPKTVLTDHLCVSIKLLTGTSSVVAMCSLQGPAAIGLCLNLKCLIGSLTLAIARKVTSRIGRQVLALGSDEGIAITQDAMKSKN